MIGCYTFHKFFQHLKPTERTLNKQPNQEEEYITFNLMHLFGGYFVFFKVENCNSGDQLFVSEFHWGVILGNTSGLQK